MNRILESSRRLCILVALSLAPKYKLTLKDIRAIADESGYPGSLAVIQSDCAWLNETGMVDVKDDIYWLTDRGLDVASGRSTVPGISRPGPGA